MNSIPPPSLISLVGTVGWTDRQTASLYHLDLPKVCFTNRTISILRPIRLASLFIGCLFSNYLKTCLGGASQLLTSFPKEGRSCSLVLLLLLPERTETWE